jgi:hypothetical protein
MGTVKAWQSRETGFTSQSCLKTQQMLVSTFELLVTKIAPPGGSPADSIVRNVVQAYFLNIANPNTLGCIFRTPIHCY